MKTSKEYSDNLKNGILTSEMLYNRIYELCQNTCGFNHKMNGIFFVLYIPFKQGYYKKP